MDDGLRRLAQETQRLAAVLPAELAYALAETISQQADGNRSYARAKALNAVASPVYRARIADLFRAWEQLAPEVSGQSVALALLTASVAESAHRESQSVELVWTGPDSHVIPVRRTDQALLQLIAEARTRLLIVSFAVYKAESILQSIHDALQRGVVTTLCLETPDASEGKIAFDTIKALGADVAQHAQLYVWPHDQRPHSPDGKHGSLHAKVAVADGATLLISSANLTEYAMTLNMELGVLIRGGELPAKVEAHFAKLIEQRILRRI
jgi:phosphatidylserine/phosphatidylglycerophosphate/cardiolipin synthase-like enzyme